ncbi:MAG: hypothetical protein WCA35_16345, partial [Kovacikia sp.]
ASSETVFSPRTVSSATLALNCGLYCLRLLLVNYSYHLLSGSELNLLSSFSVPLQLDTWLDPWTYEREKQPSSKLLPKAKEVITRFKKLQKLAGKRVQEINQALAEVEAIETGIIQAQIASKGMQQQELFSRYQRNINRELYEALDRLEAIQQRRNGGSMGSFGQTLGVRDLPWKEDQTTGSAD